MSTLGVNDDYFLLDSSIIKSADVGKVKTP